MSLLVFGFATSSLLSCTNATPVVSLLSFDLFNTEQPKAPQLEITAPPENSYSQGTVNLTGTCTSGISVLISGSDLASGSQTIDCLAGLFNQTIALSASEGTKLIDISQTNATGKTTRVSRTLIKDTVGPSMELDQMPGQADLTALVPIFFDLVFSEPVDASAFLSSSVVNGGTATGIIWSLLDSGNHMNFTLSATAIATSGTVIPSFAAGAFKDLAGNSGTASTSTDNTVTYDPSLPRVLSVTSITSDGTYVDGDSISIQVTFDKAVLVSGALPSLTLETGSVNAIALYSGGSGTSTLSFIYAVTATDFSADLEFENPSINSNGGWIKDSSGNQASLSVPTSGGDSLSGSKNLKIVGTPASLTISGGPVFDFGNVFFGSQGTHTFTLTNSALSVVEATGILGSPAVAMTEFAFEGGTFPGTSGTCTSTLAPGSSCSIVLLFIPSMVGLFTSSFSVTYANGVANGLLVSKSVTGTGTPALLTVTSPYPGNENWNDYVKFTDPGKKFYIQANTSCDGSEVESMGRVGGCVHSGEIRKVHFPSLSSCNNLTAVDTLGIFTWICDDTGGSVNFYSSGFHQGKGLRDLIDISIPAVPTWKTNKVELRYFGNLIGESSPQPWWTNPFQNAFPAGDSLTDATVNLSNYGTIYIIYSTKRAYILNIANDKIALVTLNDSTLSANAIMQPAGIGNCNTTDGTIVSGNAGASALICLGSKKFLWIEADLLGGGGGVEKAAAGILAYDLKYSRIHRTSIQQFDLSTSYPLLNLVSSSSNLVTDLELSQGSAGLKLTSTSLKNEFRNLKVSQIRGNGISGGSALHLTSNASQNRFYDVSIADVKNSSSPLGQGVTVSSSANIFQRLMISDIHGSTNNSAGVRVNGGQANIFVQLGSFSSTNTGLMLDTSVGNIFSHYTAANHDWNGIYVKGSTNNSNNYFQSVVIANGGDKAIEIGDASSGYSNLFQSMVIAHSTTYSIQDPGTWFNWVPMDSFFLKSPSGDICSSATSTRCTTDIPFINSTVNLANAFVGKTTSDLKNTIDTSGQSLYSDLANLAHWLNFDSWLRGWGKSGSSFPYPDNRGYCASGNICQIWDWRVQSGSAIHNRSGNGSSLNAPFNSGAPCPTAVHGNNAITHNGITFLFNAIEIDRDGIGNDNGLCESEESCIYAPNLGAYQGEGAIREQCAFSNGLVFNVIMRAYSTTGQ